MEVLTVKCEPLFFKQHPVSLQASYTVTFLLALGTSGLSADNHSWHFNISSWWPFLAAHGAWGTASRWMCYSFGRRQQLTVLSLECQKNSFWTLTYKSWSNYKNLVVDELTIVICQKMLQIVLGNTKNIFIKLPVYRRNTAKIIVLMFFPNMNMNNFNT